MPRFSETLMDHFQYPRNKGCLENPDRVGKSGSQGRSAEFLLHLKLDNGRIVQVGYKTGGCGAVIASGSVLSQLIKNKTIEECLRLTPADLISALDGVPPDRRWCVQVPLKALHNALQEWIPQ